jgi:hypothetical protein
MMLMMMKITTSVRMNKMDNRQFKLHGPGPNKQVAWAWQAGRQARVLATAMALSPQLPRDEETKDQKTKRLRD